MKKKFKLQSVILIILFAGNGLWNQINAQGLKQGKKSSVSNLSGQQVQERLNFINNSLQAGEGTSRFWYWGFLGLYSAGTITQLSLYFAAPSLESDPVKLEYLREDMMTGTITTGLGAVFLAISPMPSMYARNQYMKMADDTLEQKREKLSRAEEALRMSAVWEKENRSFLIHAINFGVNLGAGLVIWLAFNRTIVDGLLTFLPGFAVGEIQIFTQPTRAIHDWERYEAKYASGSAYQFRQNDDRLWHIAAAPGGLMVIREF